MTALILTVILVLLLSALASGTEAAIFSVPYSKARAMVMAKKPGAKALLQVKDGMSRSIGTIVIVNNIANIVGSAIVGAIAVHVFLSAWMGVFFAVFTLTVIIAGELIPKTLGEAYAERIARLAAPFVLATTSVFRPVLWLVDAAVRPFRRRAPGRTVSEEEIKVMALLGRETGSIERDEVHLIQRAFKLNDITAEDMMTSAPNVETLSEDAPLSSLREKILTTRHSRIPVHGEAPDIIHGVVMLRDLLAAMAKDKFEATPADYAQEPLLVPKDMPADDLLPLFQQKEQHLAVVVDADKKMVGVVTLEDVLEELVGEITDEKDIRPDTIKRVSKNEILADEGTEVSKINHFFNTAIEYHGTVGDYVMEKIGRRPKVGETFQDGPMAATVMSMTRTRPKIIHLRKAG